ncbi:MAG: cadherin repeat domain-containing protein, partial [Sulfurovum sp.]|nr:cadherin repeat domain-containing protein [Sulfurovum sp.]
MTAQVDKYEASIRSGHRVLVVAHSQGNLFAQEAYEKLGERSKDHEKWLQKYWEAISIASPDPFTDIKPNMLPRIGWDNDMVAIMGGSNNNSCNIRQVYWELKAHIIGETYPAKPVDNYVRKSDVGNYYKQWWKAKEGFAQKYLESNVHAFTFYMGLPLKEGNEKKPNYNHIYINPFTNHNLVDVSAKSLIMDQIDTMLKRLEAKPSQWIPKNLGCQCKEKYAKLTHRYEKDTFTFPQERVKDFAENTKGKIYMVDGKYVRAKCGGVKIEEVDSGDTCLVLKDEQGVDIGDVKGEDKNPKKPGGLFTAQLGWSETAVHMELSSPLMPERVSGCGMAAAGSGAMTLYDVYPGTYSVNVVNVDGYQELEGNISDNVTLHVHAVTANKSDSYTVTNKYQYPNLGNGGGHIADIVITRPEPDVPPAPIIIPSSGGYGGYGGSSGSGGSGGGLWYIGYGGSRGGSWDVIPVVQNDPPLCEPAFSCGCLPCEYNILTYLSQARLGPISGATVRLYKATQENDPNREVLYEGETTVSNDIDKAGIIMLPVPYPQQPESEYTDRQRAFMEAIKGYDGDFVLEVSGGFDIDNDDDLHTDSTFRQVNGKLPLILSKERLIQNDYKVNILTEIGYQLSRDLLGENYDKARLQARLDDIAKHILIEKLYPSAKQSIGRDDLMWWIPAAHKNWLLKPYDTTLKPIVEKVYRGEDIYDVAYRYVYDEMVNTDSGVPLLKSQWFKADENVSGGTLIGQVIPLSEGNATIDGYTLDGEGSELFRIESDGKVYLKENASLDFETKDLYQLRITASNSFGKSRPVTLYITVNNIPDVPEDKGFSGGYVSEDAPEGTVAGRVKFDPGAAPIDRIEISGRYAESFTVDLNGTIRVSGNATLDYEHAPAAHITLRAHNALGYGRLIPI